MTNTNLDRLVEEVLVEFASRFYFPIQQHKFKHEDAHDFLRTKLTSALSQARQEGREEAFKESLELVDKQLLALTTEGK